MIAGDYQANLFVNFHCANSGEPIGSTRSGVNLSLPTEKPVILLTKINIYYYFDVDLKAFFQKFCLMM